MLKKIASLAAMLSASLTLHGCETSMYKPIICETGTALKNGRCARVEPIGKRTVLAPVPKQKKAAKKSIAGGQGLSQQPRRVNEYGMPF